MPPNSLPSIISNSKRLLFCYYVSACSANTFRAHANIPRKSDSKPPPCTIFEKATYGFIVFQTLVNVSILPFTQISRTYTSFYVFSAYSSTCIRIVSSKWMCTVYRFCTFSPFVLTSRARARVKILFLTRCLSSKYLLNIENLHVQIGCSIFVID